MELQAAAVPAERLIDILEQARLAPSAHNAQPWKFAAEGAVIKLYPDFARRLPVFDPDDRVLFMGLGSALENLLIAARYYGYRPTVEYFPAREPRQCLVVRLVADEPGADSVLFSAIPKRQSTRRRFAPTAPPAEHLAQLQAAADLEGVGVHLFTDPGQIGELMEFVKEANRHLFGNPAFVEELLGWMRFTRVEAEVYKDGLAAVEIGLPYVPRWLGERLIELLALAEVETTLPERLAGSTPVLMLLAAEQADRAGWVKVGRSFERMALTATALDIKHTHHTAPCVVPEVRQRLQQRLDLAPAQPALLLGLGYAEAMPRSVRRPLTEVLM